MEIYHWITKSSGLLAFQAGPLSKSPAEAFIFPAGIPSRNQKVIIGSVNSILRPPQTPFLTMQTYGLRRKSLLEGVTWLPRPCPIPRGLMPWIEGNALSGFLSSTMIPLTLYLLTTLQASKTWALLVIRFLLLISGQAFISYNNHPIDLVATVEAYHRVTVIRLARLLTLSAYLKNNRRLQVTRSARSSHVSQPD